MRCWHREIDNDLNLISEFCDFYEEELKKAQEEFRSFTDEYIVVAEDKLPIYYEYRSQQLMEIDAVLEIMEIKVKVKRSEVFRRYHTNYDKVLSSTDINRYSDSDPEIVSLLKIQAEVSYLRGKYFKILSAYEMKHYAIGNIVKLRCAGLEDARL